MSQTYSHVPNQFCYSNKMWFVWIDWISLALRGGGGDTTQMNISTYPSTCPFTHPARHRFPWQGCCSLWQTYWQAREELGIMGLEDDTSACQVDVEKAYTLSTGWTHLCGMHGIHVAAPWEKRKKLLDENQSNQLHLWTCTVAACFLFICLTQDKDRCLRVGLIMLLTFKGKEKSY